MTDRPAADATPSSFTRHWVLGGLRRAARGATSGTRAATRTAAAAVAAGYACLTGMAKAVILAAAVSLVLGAVFGWSELIYLGATLVVALLASSVFLIGRTAYRVDVRLNPRRVVAGQRAMGGVTVTNAAAKPTPAVSVELPVGAGQAQFVLPRLAVDESTEEFFAVPTSRRSVVRAGPMTSVRGDQLGLLRRTMSWGDAVELFVHPPTVRLAASSYGLVRDLEGQPTTTITDNDLAFHALRSYEAGDDIRNVHWRSSARVGQLMVRQYQETRRSQLFLLVATQESNFRSDDEFELAVSAAASVACEVIGESTPLNVAWGSGRMRVRTPTALLDDSCRMTRTRSDVDVRHLARTHGRRLPDPSIVIIVSGSTMPDHELRAAASLYGQDAHLIAVRCEPDAPRGLTRVGRFTQLRLPALTDLPGLLTRAAA